MKTNKFSLKNVKGHISYHEAINNEGLEFINFACVDSSNNYSYYIVMNPEQFITFLETHRIIEVLDDNVILDFYIDDEEGITCLETVSLPVQDYVLNYISNDVIENIIRISLLEFTNKI